MEGHEGTWRSMKGLWSPSIAPTVQAGRGLLAMLFTGKRNAFRKMGKGISTGSRKMWLKCVTAGDISSGSLGEAPCCSL